MYPPRTRGLLSVSATDNGQATVRRNVAIAGIAASAAIAVAPWRFAQTRSAPTALISPCSIYALAESERARHALKDSNERVQRKNAELRTLQIAVAQVSTSSTKERRDGCGNRSKQAAADLAHSSPKRSSTTSGACRGLVGTAGASPE